MAERSVAPLQHTTLQVAIYRELKHLLLTQRFDPTVRLNTNLLERQLGVSRTPLKDALNRLAHEGFIEVRARRGYFVRRPTIKDAVELYDLRRLHEVYAVERAISIADPTTFQTLREILEQQRPLAVDDPSDEEYERFTELDRELHRAIVRAAGNRRLEQIYDQLDGHIQMARVYYLTARTTMPETFREHEAIVTAIEARDVGEATRRLVAHIERFRHMVLHSLGDPAGDGTGDAEREG